MRTQNSGEVLTPPDSAHTDAGAGASAADATHPPACGENLFCLLPEHTAGDRLTAGLAADQLWRRRREETLRKRLVTAHRLESIGRGGCVLAGPVVLACWIFAFGGQSLPVVLKLVAPLASATAILFPLSGILSFIGSTLKWRLIGHAQENGVLLPMQAASVPTVGSACATEHADDGGRAAVIQHDLDKTHAAERAGSDLCLRVSWASLPVLAVLLANSISDDKAFSWMVILLVVMLLGALLLIALQIAAFETLLRWERRKQLLRHAAREGLDVRDPARCSWE